MTANSPTISAADPESDSQWLTAPRPRLLGVMLAGAVAFTVAVQNPVGVVATISLGSIAALGPIGGWARTTTARWFLLASLGPIAMLTVRSSQWLVGLNGAFALALVALAAVVRAEPRPVGAAIGRMFRPRPVIEPAVMSFELLGNTLDASIPSGGPVGERALRLLRGLVLAGPVVLAVGALLAASDAVFKSLLSLPIDLATLADNGVLLVIGWMASMALVGHGLWGPIQPPRPIRHRLGAAEMGVTLAGVAVVYLAFVAVQVVTIAAGADYVLRTTGLTYAEYARRGFFQLVAAAVLTVAVLLLFCHHGESPTAKAARTLLRFELAVLALTGVVVAVAIRRLALYEAEFGLTMLRLGTIVFAVWIACVLIALGLHLSHRLPGEFPTTVIATAFAALMLFGLVNPEALVARRNIERFHGSGELDVDYLVDNLGADALPVVITDPRAARRVCARGERPDDGWLAFNIGRRRGAAAYDAVCG